jgi:hypothetical protein
MGTGIAFDCDSGLYAGKPHGGLASLRCSKLFVRCVRNRDRSAFMSVHQRFNLQHAGVPEYPIF